MEQSNDVLFCVRFGTTSTRNSTITSTTTSQHDQLCIKVLALIVLVLVVVMLVVVRVLVLLRCDLQDTEVHHYDFYLSY